MLTALTHYLPSYRSPTGIRRHAVIGLSIATSKRGYIWPVGYWKPLIDALSRGGSKGELRMYPSIAHCLASFTYTSNGRTSPIDGSALASRDDADIVHLKVSRVRPGCESLSFHTPATPSAESPLQITVPYFGTIGDSKYERQSQANRELLESSGGLPRNTEMSGMWLHFELSTQRRDRDLDNLADPLLPIFNRRFRNLAEVQLSKTHSSSSARERLSVVLYASCIPNAA